MAFNKPKLLRIKVGAKEIFHEVDFTLDVTTDYSEVSTKDTNGKQNVAGAKSWSASVNTIVADDVTTSETNATLVAYSDNDTLLDIIVTDAVSGHLTYTGKAYIEGFNLSAGVDGNVGISYSLKGDGLLVTTTNI